MQTHQEMAEEFQESDVFWPEQSYRREDRLRRSVFQDENVDPAEMGMNNSASGRQNSGQRRRKKSKQSGSHPNSLPVNIPCSSNRNRNSNSNSNKLSRNNNNNNSSLHFCDLNEIDDEVLEGSKMVPPHLIVADRFSRQMAFSVCTGNGRTLKGRDLSRVRNSILRLTGFLET